MFAIKASRQPAAVMRLFIHYPTPAAPADQKQREKIGKRAPAPIGFCAQTPPEIIAFAFNID
jgi:hypothetical protein